MHNGVPPPAFPEFNRPLAPWSWSEDKLFEQALVVFPEDLPGRWERIAGLLPGRSAVEVKQHYDALVYDIGEIDSGRVELPSYADDESDDSGLADWKDSACEISSGSKMKQVDVERKRGTPWTKEEHKLFLIGLERYGKGDWRSISRLVVVTRTPTQVASHAQKYFLRLSSGKNDKQRPSIHDITTVESNPAAVPFEPFLLRLSSGKNDKQRPSIHDITTVESNPAAALLDQNKGSNGQDRLSNPNQGFDQGLGGSFG